MAVEIRSTINHLVGMAEKTGLIIKRLNPIPLLRERRLPRAPKGTYTFLEEVAAKFYNPGSEMGGIFNSQGELMAMLAEETECPETGGSCLDLILAKGTGSQRWNQFAHITQRDGVVDIGSSNKTPVSVDELIEGLRSLIPEGKTFQETHQ